MNTESYGARFVAGDRVRLLEDRAGMKKGATGTITAQRTMKEQRSISPDASGNAMFFVFDGVIGTLTIPTQQLEKLTQ
jgi:hypothetical protein